ncbi:unnamed protein product [Effrenium voratum]|nr:unnamed protein product [Effrenium voratum]
MRFWLAFLCGLLPAVLWRWVQTQREREPELRAFLQEVEDANLEAEELLSELWEGQFRKMQQLDNITVVTVDTGKPRHFVMLGASQLPVINAGADQTWHSWYDKPRLYEKFLRHFAAEQPDRMVVLVDGFDTISGGCTEEQLLAAFQRTASHVVWGAESCCFPWRQDCQEFERWAGRRAAILREFGMDEAYERQGDCRRCRDLDIPGYDSFCSSPPAYQHLNSGFLMGPAKKVHNAVQLWLSLYTNRSETDQLVARSAFFLAQNWSLDYSGSLVLTAGNIPESAVPELFDVRDGVIWNRLTGTAQCFIHGAGPGKVFLVRLLQALDGTRPLEEMGARAAADCNRAVELEPFNGQVLLGRALVLRDQGRLREARKTNKIEKQLSCSTLGSQHGQQRRQSSGAAMFFALTGTDTGDDEAPKDTIAHRFCAFAMKTLNEDMDPLFERFLPLFDQDRLELAQQGETHEQYAAYREYVATLEENVSNFALQEGYSPGDASNFLRELQQAVEEDKVRAEKQVEAFLMHMEQQRKQKMGDAPPLDEGEVQLMRKLFRPQTVDDLMQMLLHMTEYTAFSSLMRAKVQQQKFMRELERRKKELMMGEMGLAHRFISFAMKLLNDDLQEFYSRCLPIFDQEAADLQNHGHTHEQHAAFQEHLGA